jgi:urease accessory protein
MLVSSELRHNADATSPADQAGWRAELSLDFACRDGRTVLVAREHRGPLVVQRPLYEEGPQVCQVVIVHPPGGIAGGDRLGLRANVGEQGHVVFTSPGAAKWYRSAGPRAIQDVRVRVAPGAVVEWMPQETILFDGARAELRSRVELAGNALFIGWEVVCFGRTASGERFQTGQLMQASEVLHEGCALLGEYAQVEGGSRLLGSRAGLAGHPVSATMVLAGRESGRDLLARLRAVAPPDGSLAGVSTLPGVIVARFLGRSAEAARAYFTALWKLARPALAGREAVPPRIWRC